MAIAASPPPGEMTWRQQSRLRLAAKYVIAVQ
jgi:hypothetical protein